VIHDHDALLAGAPGIREFRAEVTEKGLEEMVHRIAGVRGTAGRDEEGDQGEGAQRSGESFHGAVDSGSGTQGNVSMPTGILRAVETARLGDPVAPPAPQEETSSSGTGVAGSDRLRRIRCA